MYRGATYTYPASITITQIGLNAFQPAGTLETGYRVSPIPDYSSGSLALPPGAGVTTAPDHYIRGTITAFNVTAQKSFSRNMSIQVGYAGNRQRDMVRVDEPQLWDHWRRRRQSAVLSVPRHDRGTSTSSIPSAGSTMTHFK